jgi:hypothetical protein
MWKNDLESQGYKVIHINAWKTDFDDEPFIHIASTLLDELSTDTIAEKTKSALKTALGATASIANTLLEQAIGVNVAAAMKDIEADKNSTDLQKIGEEIYKEFSFKKKAYEVLKTQLEIYINQLEKKTLIFFVDELDRVRPNYAVKFLEAIKHIFPIKGACFVLAVDRVQLEKSVKQLYGDIDFENYYRRFISREANLPEAITCNLDNFIQRLFNEYFNEKELQGIKFPFSQNQKRDIFEYSRTICRAFRFTPRQMNNLFRIYSQFLAIYDDKKMPNSNLHWLNMSMFLIASSIHKQNIYHKIGDDTATPSELLDLIKTLHFFGDDEAYERGYMILDVMGFILNDNAIKKQKIYDCSREYLKSENQDSFIRELAKRADNNRGRIEKESHFQYLYKKIEEWQSFY